MKIATVNTNNNFGMAKLASDVGEHFSKGLKNVLIDGYGDSYIGVSNFCLELIDEFCPNSTLKFTPDRQNFVLETPVCNRGLSCGVKKEVLRYPLKSTFKNPTGYTLRSDLEMAANELARKQYPVCSNSPSWEFNRDAIVTSVCAKRDRENIDGLLNGMHEKLGDLYSVVKSGVNQAKNSGNTENLSMIRHHLEIVDEAAGDGRFRIRPNKKLQLLHPNLYGELREGRRLDISLDKHFRDPQNLEHDLVRLGCELTDNAGKKYWEVSERRDLKKVGKLLDKMTEK